MRGHFFDRRGGSHERCGRGGCEFGFFVRAQGLVGLPLGALVVDRVLRAFAKVQAGLCSLLRAELGPLLHTGVEFVLFLRGQAGKILRHGQPFAFLCNADGLPLGLERCQGLLFGGAQI